MHTKFLAYVTNSLKHFIVGLVNQVCISRQQLLPISTYSLCSLFSFVWCHDPLVNDLCLTKGMKPRLSSLMGIFGKEFRDLINYSSVLG